MILILVSVEKFLYEGIYLFLILFVTSFIIFYEGIVGDLTWVMLPKVNWLNFSQERERTENQLFDMLN